LYFNWNLVVVVIKLHQLAADQWRFSIVCTHTTRTPPSKTLKVMPNLLLSDPTSLPSIGNGKPDVIDDMVTALEAAVKDESQSEASVAAAKIATEFRSISGVAVQLAGHLVAHSRQTSSQLQRLAAGLPMIKEIGRALEALTKGSSVLENASKIATEKKWRASLADNFRDAKRRKCFSAADEDAAAAEAAGSASTSDEE
jgi:hypothetical protein